MTQPTSWDPEPSAATRIGFGRARGRGDRNIGLWGAPRSGKTTFLSALYSAVLESPLDLRFFGVNNESTDFITEMTDRLDVREFPPATQAIRELAWTLGMTSKDRVARTVTRGRRAETVWDVASVGRQVTIEMRDAPGRVYGTNRSVQPPAHEEYPSGVVLPGADPDPWAADSPEQPPEDEVIDHLSGCTGLILLVNPIEERESGSTYRYFQTTLAKVAQRQLAQLPAGSRLPHSIAVCMTMFDHPAVFSFSQRGHYHVPDQTRERFPRVPNNRAEEFLTEFCSDSNAASIDRFCKAIKRFFNADQVRFYVTTSIGFYVDRRQGVFNPDDYQNTVEQPDGRVLIRGRVNPVNVLEPLLWLSGLGGYRA